MKKLLIGLLKPMAIFLLFFVLAFTPSINAAAALDGARVLTMLNSLITEQTDELPVISETLGFTILEKELKAYNGYYGLAFNLPSGYVLLDYENISTTADKTKDLASFYTESYDDGSTVTYLMWFTNVLDYNNPNYVSIQIAAEEFDGVVTMDSYIEKLTEWVTEAPADVTDTYRKTLLDKETVTIEGNEYIRVRYLETEEEYQDYMHEFYLKQYGNQFLYISFYYSNEEEGLPGKDIRNEIFENCIQFVLE